jgi:transcription antitermination factor NusG
MPEGESKQLQASRLEGAGWFAVHTRHQHEGMVARYLASKGIEVFLPQYTAVRQWSDRIKKLSLPLFPCYLFLRAGSDHGHSARSTPGVLGLVGFAGVPAVISHTEIEAIRRTIARGAEIEPYPFLKFGDWVRVKSGPLEGIEGILVRNKSHYRLVLSVELVQKSAAVEVDAWMVERVRRPPQRGPERSFTVNTPLFA